MQVEIFHPVVGDLGSRLRRARRLRGWRHFRSRLALRHAQVVLAKLHRHAPVQPLLHPHPTPSQSRADIAARNLIDLPLVANRIVGGHEPFFHMTEDRRQLMLRAQRSMRIRAALRHHREVLVPLRQVLLLQIGCASSRL